jgi:uncharacterized membrane protein HdeD (DUF308 family)
VFIASGVNEVADASMVSGGWKFVHHGIAFLFLLAGLWAFLRPINSFFALASVLGLILVFAGAFEIVRGVATRGETPYWWTGLLSGVILLLLAAWVSVSDPQASIARRSYLILFWVGFMALLRGFTQIMMGFSLRHLGTETVSRDTGETGAGDVPPTVPAQERRGVSEPESAQQTVPRQ